MEERLAVTSSVMRGFVDDVLNVPIVSPKTNPYCSILIWVVASNVRVISSVAKGD